MVLFNLGIEKIPETAQKSTLSFSVCSHPEMFQKLSVLWMMIVIRSKLK